MSEPLRTLSDRIVAWLEPGVGRDLGVEPERLGEWVAQRLLPEVLDAIEGSAPRGEVPRVLDALAELVPRSDGEGPEPGFVGRGRAVYRDLDGWLRARVDDHVQRVELDLDALSAEAGTPALELRLVTARALRAGGHRLARSLGALERGRWRRWEGPKREVVSGWLVSLGHVPSQLREPILASEPQRERWRRQLGLDADALTSMSAAHRRCLVVDTRLHPAELAMQIVDGLAPEVVASASTAIRADNADALRWLSCAGLEARCVFIDPPYNTGGSDFDYDDLYPGDSWARMMQTRLALARELVPEDGVLVATIDDGEVATLRRTLERAFGPDNFITQAVWHKKYARQNDATWFSTSHDHVLVAARDKSRWRPRRIPRTAAQNKAYRNPDDDPRGLWQSVVYTCNKTAEQRPNLYYAITHPRTGEEVWPERNRVWAFSPQAHARNEREGKVWWGRNGERDKPRQKVFLRDVDRGMVPDTLWTREQVGDNQDAQRELAALFGRDGTFATPKPLRLVMRVITLGSDPGDTVLDFFAGSGTTAHAVLELDRVHDDRPRRRFVVVESGETFEDVLLPRIEKVAFARAWEDGRPVGGGGIEVAVRIVGLESYDDVMEELRSDPDPWFRLLEDS